MFNNQYYKKRRNTINHKELIKLVGVIAVLLLSWIIIVGPEDKTDKEEEAVKVFTLKEVVSRAYSDNINVYLTKENKTIDIKIEDYLAGVISSEMPVSFELEALKAQAVAARTFALGRTVNNCSKGNGADICDTIHCQVYKTKEMILNDWPKGKGEEYYEKILKAVEETKGQVLSYNNDLVMNAQYFSTSWGFTEDSKEVFGKEIPYLKSVPSSGEEISNRYKNNNTFTKNDFVKKINSALPKAELKEGTLSKDIEIISRNQSGSVREIRLGNATVSGVKLRSILGLYSANFTIDIDSEVYVNSLGYGHGVGMSQWGANVMGKAGKSYRDILLHYYTGVSIETIKFK